MIIVGEAHHSVASVRDVEKLIREKKPSVLIHELIWDYSGTGKDLKPNKLTEIKQYAQGTNDDVFKPAIELKIESLIGCDLPEDKLNHMKDLSLAEQFDVREQRMFKIAKRYSGRSDVVMVVGDIHLREKPSKDFPLISKLVEAVKEGTLEAEIKRVPTSLREHK